MIYINKKNDKEITVKTDSGKELTYPAVFLASETSGGEVCINAYANYPEFAMQPVKISELSVNGCVYSVAGDAVSALNSFIGSFKSGGSSSSPTTLLSFEPNKKYKANEAIVYEGEIWTAKSDFTSGDSFDVDDWNAVGVTFEDLDLKLDSTENYGIGLSRFFHENDGGGYQFDDGVNIYFAGADTGNEGGSPGILLYVKNKASGIGKRLKLTLNNGILANDGTVSDVFLKVLKTSDIDDSLTSTSILQALSANMGRELAVKVDAANGSGGFIEPNDFGSATPTQQALTDYAMNYIFGSDAPSHDPTEIFNGTKVQNLFDKRVWQLANTPNSQPPIFSWEAALVVSEAQRDFTANPIQTAEITDGSVTNVKLASAIQTRLGYVDTAGSISAALNAKANEITSFTEASQRTNINTGDSVTAIWGKIKKFFTDLKTVAFTGSYSDLSGIGLLEKSDLIFTQAELDVNDKFVCSVSENTDIGISTLTAGKMYIIAIKNNGSSTITVRRPSTSSDSANDYIYFISAGREIEVSVWSDGTKRRWLVSEEM
jgi:hypothetical protein